MSAGTHDNARTLGGISAWRLNSGRNRIQSAAHFSAALVEVVGVGADSGSNDGVGG